MAKRIIDYYNLFVGAAVTIAAAILGEHWYLFAAFLALNVVDWLTGWYKANKQGVESSKVGLKGALKKLGYWAVVAVAFELAGCLQALCVDMLGLQLDWLLLLGWWVLASLIVNEARSILENLVEMGYDVPGFLVKGLAVTQKLIEAKNPAANLTDAERRTKPWQPRKKTI